MTPLLWIVTAQPRPDSPLSYYGPFVTEGAAIDFAHTVQNIGWLSDWAELRMPPARKMLHCAINNLASKLTHSRHDYTQRALSPPAVAPLGEHDFTPEALAKAVREQRWDTADTRHNSPYPDQDRFLRTVYDRTVLAPNLLAAAKLDSKAPAIWRAIQAAYVATIYNLIGETSP